MPLNSANVVLEEVVGTHAEAVAASVWLFDNSVYAAGARDELERLLEPSLSSVVLRGSLGDWKEVSEPLFTSGFHLIVQPLTLLDRIPGICYWVAEATKENIEVIAKNISECDQAHGGAFWHVVLLSGQDHPGAAKLASALERKGAVVLVSPDAAIKHSLEFLGQATAVYGYSVWCRYWRHPQKDLSKAMWRPPGHGLLTLGLSGARVNVEYHARRWQAALCRDQWQQWLKPAKLTPGTRPPSRSLIQILRHILPDWYLAFSEESRLPKLSISSPEETVLIAYQSPSERPNGKGWWPRDLFGQWMVRLRAHVDFLGFIALANCRRFVGRQSRSLSSWLSEPLRTFITLPAEPEGMLEIMRTKARLCANYGRDLARLRIGEDDQPKTRFEEDWKRAVRRVSAVPNIPGALARLALLAIGLAWLTIGPCVWLGAGNPLKTPTLSVVTVASGIALCACVLGVLLHYYYASLLAVHTLERAFTRAEKRHLAQVGGLAVEKVRRVADELEKRFQNKTEEVERLREQARNLKAAVSPDPRTVGPDNVSLAAVDSALKPMIEQMKTALYSSFRERLNAAPDDHLPVFEHQAWEVILKEIALAVARERIALLRYEDCIARENGADARLGALFSNLVTEGTIPALAGALPDPGANTVLFGTPALWDPHRGKHDQVEFHPIHSRALFLLSVHSANV